MTSLTALFKHIGSTDDRNAEDLSAWEGIREKVLGFIRDKVFPLKAELLKPKDEMERHITNLVKQYFAPGISKRPPTETQGLKKVFGEDEEMLENLCKYEKLGHKKATKGRFLAKKLNGRVKGLKLSRSRKFNWKPFSITYVLSRKIISKICAGFVKMDDVYPAIVFSGQWGLPALSHSSVKSRKSCVSCYDKSLTWF
ncbi:hypothetical protein CASFOL_004461 [Castilleja foliolosa]|uniref:Uncharacterized protein n=1 Tax=Castilleja foliolosa TaxID=1961234 RepID=A0ABD3EE97_9LAMI